MCTAEKGSTAGQSAPSASDLSTITPITPNLDPKLVEFVIQRSKELGNKAFKQRKYAEAIKLYTDAIEGDPKDRSLFSNRSAAHLAIGLYDQALEDARRAVEIAPGWAKAHYRQGCAHAALNQWAAAVEALRRGLELEPSSEELRGRLDAAESRVAAAAAARRAAAASERRSLVLKLREARRADQRLAMLNQFKQSMAAPDWDLEDLEWRPTWVPSARLTPLDLSVVRADPKKAALLGYVATLADLAHPKAALAILSDTPRLAAFDAALARTLAEKSDLHVLALGAGGGVLALMAARAGASRVTAVERSRMLYRMAKQILTGNSDVPGASNVHLVARSLQAVGVAGEEEGLCEGEGGSAPQDRELLPRRADVLVTDLMDHAVLGAGLLPALDYAAAHLLAPGATVVPQRVRMMAALVELALPPTISGFDLSALDCYRWYPGDEKVDLSVLSHRMLSKPFSAHSIDLEARVAAVQSKLHLEKDDDDGEVDENEKKDKEKQQQRGRAQPQQSHWEADFEIDVEVTEGGRWNAVAFWFELDMGDGAVLASGVCPPSGSSDSSAAVRRSWGQAVQYVDPRAVASGTVVRLRVRQDSGQVLFTPDPPPCRLRHALAPRWHYDMVQDILRNAAYDAALRSAVTSLRAEGRLRVSGLDIGTGTGLLAMMAVRAGADDVVAAELSAHMCDVAEETTLANGFLGSILVVDRDVRRMSAELKPDGTPPELPQRADLAVFEIFDSGLIGEGALHCLAAARARLLTVDAALVPASATVYAQPLEMRVDTAAGLDVAQANRWRWRPDYEGVELAARRGEWRALATPLEVFSFDFAEVERHMVPEEAALAFAIDTPGVANAVAMWFELRLDADNVLTTSPHAEKGPTWQQAVQWLPEVRVEPGEVLSVTARHDTYSISYELGPGVESRRTDVPVVDPVWKEAYDGMAGVHGALAKACAQNPLEYRAAATAALQFAARPGDLGLDASAAAEFCMRMMG